MSPIILVNAASHFAGSSVSGVAPMFLCAAKRAWISRFPASALAGSASVLTMCGFVRSRMP